jgi:hypothetical protein
MANHLGSLAAAREPGGRVLVEQRDYVILPRISRKGPSLKYRRNY